MKWFWVIVLVLVGAAGTLLLVRGRTAGTGNGAGGVTVTRGGESPLATVEQPRKTEPAPSVSTWSGEKSSNADADSSVSVPTVGTHENAEMATQPKVTTPVAKPVEKAAEIAPVQPTPASSETKDAHTSRSVESSPAGDEESAQTPSPSSSAAGAVPSSRATTEQQAAEAAKARAMAEALDAALRGEDPFSMPAKSADSPASPSGGSSAGMPTPTASQAASSENADKASSMASAEPKLEPQADGTILVDGKYVIAGKGTHEQPYRVSWEMLTSAERTYQPRLGRKEIPSYLTMLNDKWVTIGGYIAFPIMAQTQDEMLMMLNQWDGCCIGVPPTPYDAIEVKLKAAAKGDDRMKVTGSITGKFKVDPFLVKDWLVSLYLMDDAELAATGTAQAAPAQHQGK